MKFPTNPVVFFYIFLKFKVHASRALKACLLTAEDDLTFHRGFTSPSLGDTGVVETKAFSGGVGRTASGPSSALNWLS